MKNLKLFCESNQKKPNEFGRLCKTVLSDQTIDFRGSLYLQMQAVTRHRGKFTQDVMDEFFQEFRKS